ncbi:transposase [Leptothrix discophora]|uniref:Transposase n=1 Tax=Leptothrix discophora TaxID=89 RepID=A0ABT9G622_LEPDI|nr:transposase [Leptothrix discophora]MDP4301941.1 transposase [Leptothrix discophora]
MARLPRLALAGLPHLVLQRGLAHPPVFADAEDRRAYLAALHEAAANLKIVVHAYALLDDQVRLLLTPPDAQALSKLMQAVGRRYVSAHNRRHGRAGTLWDGRFRATVIEAEPWLLLAARHIEQSPLRAGLVVQASDWPWSSAAHHLGRLRDTVVSAHPLFWGLGNTPFERELAWQRLLDEPLPVVQQQQIEAAMLKGWPLGSGAFLAHLGGSTDRPLVPRPRGRPPRAPGQGAGPRG